MDKRADGVKDRVAEQGMLMTTRWAIRRVVQEWESAFTALMLCLHHNFWKASAGLAATWSNQRRSLFSRDISIGWARPFILPHRVADAKALISRNTPSGTARSH